MEPIIEIQTASGGIQQFTLKKPDLTFGRAETCDLRVKDSTLQPVSGKITRRGSSDKPQFWISMDAGEKPGRLSDIEFRETEWPFYSTFNVGESRLILLPTEAQSQDRAPTQPENIKQWKTRSDIGVRMLWSVKKASSTPLAIYIGGETGTGKEVIAHLIHAWSDRASGPFVPLNCGALPLSLAESELFGHVKGAYTGATHHRSGAFLQAHNGTLFLDEIGDLSPELQVKLLRFLEDGEIRPVGSDRPTHANVRLICATHLPLDKLVEEGRFRRDLYYRVASVTIELPTLRDRPEDIEFLAREFATDLGKRVSEGALLKLKTLAWPGNVRELRHAIERACGNSGALHTTLTPEHFDFLATTKAVSDRPEHLLGGVLTLHDMERVLLLRTLKLVHGNRALAAKTLGVARSTLFEMLKRHRIQGPRAQAALAKVQIKAMAS